MWRTFRRSKSVGQRARVTLSKVGAALSAGIRRLLGFRFGSKR
jgi:hypothetical protein